MTQERFISLVRTEQEPLRRFLLALCGGDAALADDIAQDALVRAYVASGSFLGLSKFSTWLFRIAYNCRGVRLVPGPVQIQHLALQDRIQLLY